MKIIALIIIIFIIIIILNIIKRWKRSVTLIVISAQFLREITEFSLQQILIWLGEDNYAKYVRNDVKLLSFEGEKVFILLQKIITNDNLRSAWGINIFIVITSTVVICGHLRWENCGGISNVGNLTLPVEIPRTNPGDEQYHAADDYHGDD